MPWKNTSLFAHPHCSKNSHNSNISPLIFFKCESERTHVINPPLSLTLSHYLIPLLLGLKMSPLAHGLLPFGACAGSPLAGSLMAGDATPWLGFGRSKPHLEARKGKSPRAWVWYDLSSKCNNPNQNLQINFFILYVCASADVHKVVRTRHN